MNYWMQIDEDNYTIMEREVEQLDQNLDWRPTRIASMALKMHVYGLRVYLVQFQIH
jgi:hypothetical protein